jgi:hypothetical protein
MKETPGGTAFVACLVMLLAACAGRSTATTRDALNACMSGAEGVPCAIPMRDEGRSSVSECTRESDGSFLCYSPDLAGVGGRVGGIEEGGR